MYRVDLFIYSFIHSFTVQQHSCRCRARGSYKLTSSTRRVHRLLPIEEQYFWLTELEDRKEEFIGSSHAGTSPHAGSEVLSLILALEPRNHCLTYSTESRWRLNLSRFVFVLLFLVFVAVFITRRVAATPLLVPSLLSVFTIARVYNQLAFNPHFL